MNFFIETLNQWGENFLSFAWPMLWQSSLLITGLFAFDFLFRRKLRASIRYALWLVVLVKLCVPPTLALPTSPAWWWHATPPPVAAKPLPHYAVTYDTAPLPELPTATLPVFVLPPPVMAFAAWLLVVSSAVSFALFGWMLVRWWQVARMVRLAAAAEQFSGQLREAMRLAGVPNARQTSVRLKIVAGQISPAVCGLFHPTILLPQALAENFSNEQLRAVLLHELIHLRRRDVWVNFLQALLQIFYWWHPLVWVANARIRRVREEAVDDAVMLALRDDAETYAPTLLEVAKLALNRPLASLGLVGIMESRSALRQRIERLVDFRAPRHAGLTLVSLLGIVAFTAVAVPMGEGPTPRTNEIRPSATAPQNSDSVTIDGSTGRGENRFSLHRIIQLPPPTNPPTILVTAHFFQMSGVDFQKQFSSWRFKHDEANVGSWVAAWPQPFSSILSQLKSSGLQQFSAPRAVTISGSAVTMSIGNGTNETEFDCTPVATNGQVNLTFFYRVVEPQAGILVTNQFQAVTLLQSQGGVVVSSADVTGKSGSNLVALVSAEIITNPEAFRKSSGTNQFTSSGAGRQSISNQLDRIRFDSVAYNGVPLSDVLRLLAQKSRLVDPEHQGVNFMINPNADQSRLAIASPKSITNYEAALDPGQFTVKLNLTNVSLADLLVAITNVAQNPNAGDVRKIQYAIKDYGIVFQPMSPQFFTREFKVDTNTFEVWLRQGAKVSGSNSTSIFNGVGFKAFRNLGVNLESPPGKSIYYKDRTGRLLVRATQQDLDVIEGLMHKLNVPPPPQIQIKARFIEVPKGYNLKSLAMRINAETREMVGIMNHSNFQANLNELKAKKGFEILAEPEVTTASGRPSRLMVGTQIPIIGSVPAEVTAELAAGLPAQLVSHGSVTNNNVAFHTTPLDIGVILDSTATVLADGYTIQLRAQSSLTEFFGYAAAKKSSSLPESRPSIRVRKMETTTQIYDAQTLLLGGFKSTTSAEENIPKKSDKELLVFVTATIVDPAGNRVHSDEDLPFAQTGIPTQPPPQK